ncbi:MAG TPA: hypothetical protein P5117_02595 [Spirochaetia bacterium]|nr:hypothetical protein [Spirochaetales bacterium]HRY79950.1 hypothetical protein [Spirochaetia bacterium]HRZ88351.1 hypothetical protein [Spirochaetia bacterium]
MKRLLAAAAAAFVLASALPAQGSNFAQARSDHYTVWAEAGQARADELAKVLEGLFTLFEEDMRFDSSRLNSRLTVRVFRDKAGFDAHLTRVVGETRSDFVYLHYPTLERSELLVFEKEEPDFSASLAHQAYVQFLKAFIPNPPLWIREGFAVYYERSAWDAAAGTVVFQENAAWLETLKALQNSGKLLGIEALLGISPERAESARDVFYPQSWAFVSFLLDGREPRYTRFLWDSLAILAPGASLEENQGAVSALFRRWHDGKAAQEDFLAWLGSRKTFAELVETGVRLYGEKNLDESEASFAEALAKNEGNYIPYYYLGLISYGRNDFDMADYYYKTALQLGCDPATTNFALGLNAYAVNRLEDAKAYLAKAKEAAPDRYAARVDEILGRIGTP